MCIYTYIRIYMYTYIYIYIYIHTGGHAQEGRHSGAGGGNTIAARASRHPAPGRTTARGKTQVARR